MRVDKTELPWELVVMRSVSEADAPALMAAAQPLLAEFGYATLALFGRDRPGVILRAANKVPVAENLLADIDRLFAFEHRNWEVVNLDEKKLNAMNGTVLARESREGRDDKGLAVLAFNVGEAIETVQFHPEALLTEHGHAMLKNFLDNAGAPAPAP